jgi:hypothetical protein
MPLGDLSTEDQQVHQTGEPTSERQGIHIEHFAMVNDPFAKTGVLQSVRQNMDSRFCGGVFIINNSNENRMQTSPAFRAGHRALPAYSGLRVEEYLTALFPAQMASATGDNNKAKSGGSSVLDSVLAIDRDCVEKREIARHEQLPRCLAGQERLPERQAPELDRVGLDQ